MSTNNIKHAAVDELFGFNPHQELKDKLDAALDKPIVGELAVAEVIKTPVGDIRVQPKSKGITIPSGGFKNLDDHQKENLHILAQSLYAGGMDMSPMMVFKIWPTSGMKAKLAGERPKEHDIANYMNSKAFKEAMSDRDVELDEEILTAEQMNAAMYMSVNIGSTTTKLRKLGISTAKWATWRKQKAFAQYYKEVAEGQLKDSIPEMKAALANKAVEGDINAIKFAFEVTGEYNPNYKSAMDAQAFVGVVIDAILEEVKDVELRTRLQNRIAMKAQALRGIG